ncbi:APC family permease [Neobacillus cucumis]|uniref:APC family permease n=1 Tax=Neobacillus cucumis TaxID=1740721 RepID=UPI0018DF384C|nr:APC family permease [Neobacillus cucumis]MBI0576914.1 APC family permease [Neobacillus cucumis]
MEMNTGLKRSLGLWQIVMLGMGWMVPMVVFDTFGIASEASNGLVPLAYIFALVAMLFTAYSYGKMVRAFPSAGSSYTYTQKTMNPHLGFLIGWASLLDYLLIPMVSALLNQIYLTAIFPDVPPWIWIVGYVIIATLINLWGINATANVNTFLIIYQILVIIFFIILAVKELNQGMGDGTLLTAHPFYKPEFHMSGVIAAATVLCFSFLGFDAVTNYAEEALNPKTDIPKAVFITAIVGGIIFIVGAYFTQLLFPDVSKFKNPDATAPEISLYVGGKLFQLFFLAASFAGSFASGLASHASVSRLLYVMGRDNVLPKKIFGHLDSRLRTPVYNVLLVGAVTLTAIFFDLKTATEFINFGALIAFTFVNLSVIAHYAVKLKKFKTPKDFFLHIVIPMIGASFVAVLWYNLQLDSFLLGIGWVAIGIVYLLYLTKLFRVKLSSILSSEEGAKKINPDQTENTTVTT